MNTKPIAEPYTIDQHRHRFAAWAASRAASVAPNRFKVEHGVEMIKIAGLPDLFASPDNLPSPDQIDYAHRAWRTSIITAADRQYKLTLSHGVAAKLINIYFKAGFVCGGHHDHPRVQALHPPIDSLLLIALAKAYDGKLGQRFKAAQTKKWSKFNSREYEALIGDIREAMNGKPLWMMEEHWCGYR